MQRWLLEVIKNNAFSIAVQIIGFIGLLGNLYLASKLLPLADADRELWRGIERVDAKVDTNKSTNDQSVTFLKENIVEIKQDLRDIKILLNGRLSEAR